MGESGNGNGDTGPGEFSDTDALGGFSDSNVDDSSSDSGTSFGVSLGPGQGSVSATGSTAEDQSIGFSDGKGGPGDNFSAFGGITDSAGNPVGKEAQSPSEVAAAMDAISVDQALNDAVASSPVAGVNQGITPAGISPTFSPDVFDPAVDVDKSGKTAPSAIEQAAMDVPGLDAFGPVAPGFSPVGITPSVTVEALPSITQSKGIQAALSNLDKARDKAAGMGSPKGIDFGVTAPVDPDAIAAAGMPGTAANIGTTISAIDPTTMAPQLSDTIAGKAGITAGVSPAPPGFEEKVGKDFDPSKMAQMEAIYGKFDPVSGSYPTTLPGLFGIVEDKTKDALATSIALGKNVTPMEAMFGYTAPNMAKDKETIEEFNQRTKNTFSPDQIVTDTQGVVIGLKDKSGNLVTGMDPSAQAQASEEGRTEEEMREKPKSPTDPCPEGYQLIDGKCTPTEPVVTDTGFVVFPAGRTPPFRRGPFTPTTVASNPGIRGLNPITFNIPQNPFKR